jgi:hypothetical protein
LPEFSVAGAPVEQARRGQERVHLVNEIAEMFWFITVPP